MEIDNEGSPQAGEEKHACVPCYSRKVKCDKQHPCATCVRTSADCSYRDPAPPRRKKRMTEKDLLDRITKYEDHLKRVGISVDNAGGESSSSGRDGGHPDIAVRSSSIPIKALDTPDIAPMAPQARETSSKPETDRGALVTDARGRSRYLENNLWVSLHNELKNPGQVVGDSSLESSSDDENQVNVDTDPTSLLFSAASTVKGDLAASFPPQEETKFLWQAYVKNVVPITKTIHVPSFSKVIQQAQQHPRSASTSVIALIYSVMHLAAISIDNAECERALKQSKEAVQKRYRVLNQQALIKAQFLRSGDIVVLQAFVNYLLAIRLILDAQTTWAFTGLAFRIARRIGLHRDGAKLGLRPFDVEMRRRLWFQLVILDHTSSELAGLTPDLSLQGLKSWDASKPSNLNDSDLDPDMTEMPPERTGATDMIFCLMRYEMGAYFRKTGVAPTDGLDQSFQENIHKVSPETKDQLVNNLQKLLEEKFLRFCDPLEPLHYLTSVAARTALSGMQLRAHHPRQYLDRGVDMPQSERDLLFTLSIKILSYFCLVHSNPYLQGYLWHIKVYFQWHALIFALSELRERKTGDEVDKAWEMIWGVYKYNTQLLSNPKYVLHAAIISLTLKTWLAREAELRRQNIACDTPETIEMLRALEARDGPRKRQNTGAPAAPSMPTPSSSISSPFQYDAMSFGGPGGRASASPMPPQASPSHGGPPNAMPGMPKQSIQGGGPPSAAYWAAIVPASSPGIGTGILPPGSFNDPYSNPIDWAQWDNLLMSTDVAGTDTFDFDSLFFQPPPGARFGMDPLV